MTGNSDTLPANTVVKIYLAVVRGAGGGGGGGGGGVGQRDLLARMAWMGMMERTEQLAQPVLLVLREPLVLMEMMGMMERTEQLAPPVLLVLREPLARMEVMVQRTVPLAPGDDGATGPAGPAGADGADGAGAAPAQDEGITVVATPSAYNFVGDGVVVTNVGGVARVTIVGGGGVPHTHTSQYLALKATDDPTAADFEGANGVAFATGNHTVVAPNTPAGNVYLAPVEDIHRPGAGIP